jgi:glycosyltransferase involved in cell wall biosynthesis
MLVSVCTPTYNRRPFIPAMISCYLHQDYTGPKEWIIVDDGTDPIEDLITHANIPNVKYIRVETKMTLGKKRNFMHTYAKGDIIVYMDDDDYYPPQRISHAVERLSSSTALCAGSSILHIYFHHISKIIEFGPYGKNHATAGTFAFKRQLLDITSYNEDAALGEERDFLKNYTIPFIQLNPRYVILVFSHEHNTFDKRTLLTSQNKKVMKETRLQVEDFIHEPKLYHFFMNELHGLLQQYDYGDPSKKQDVLDYMKKLEIERSFCIQFGNKQLRGNEIIQQLNLQQNYIQKLTTRLNEKQEEIRILKTQLHDLGQLKK